MAKSETENLQTARLGINIVAVYALPDSHLRLVYEDGAEYTLDFRAIVARGGVMAALRDDAVFSRVRVAHDGIAIEFPGEIDFCADALRMDAEAQEKSRS